LPSFALAFGLAWAVCLVGRRAGLPRPAEAGRNV